LSKYILGSLFLVSIGMLIGIFFEKRENRTAKTFSILVAIIFALAVAPFLTNLIVYGHILGYSKELPKNPIFTGNLDVWIGFYGSFFGAIIGGAATLAAMIYNTNKLTKKSEEQLNFIKENANTNAEMQKKQIRLVKENTDEITKRYDKQLELANKPYLMLLFNNNTTDMKTKKYKLKKLDDEKNRYLIDLDLHIIFENITDRPIIDIEIYHFVDGDTKLYKFYLKPLGTRKELIPFKVIMTQLFNNRNHYLGTEKLKVTYKSINGDIYKSSFQLQFHTMIKNYSESLDEKGNKIIKRTVETLDIIIMIDE